MVWVLMAVTVFFMVGALAVAVWRVRRGERIFAGVKGFAFFGPVLALVGFVLVWGGLAPVSESRDADGYYMSDSFDIDRPSHAVVTGDRDLLRGRWETLSEESVFEFFMAAPDDIRIHAVASEPNELFIGIAATADVDAYLDGVAYDEITDWNADRSSILDIEYTAREGSAVPGPPAAETFWETSVSGTETLGLDWTIEGGEWTAVVMNADGSSPVTAELAFGASPPANFVAVAWITLVAGLVLLVGGVSMIIRAARSRGSGPTPPPPGALPPPLPPAPRSEPAAPSSSQG